MSDNIPGSGTFEFIQESHSVHDRATREMRRMYNNSLLEGESECPASAEVLQHQPAKHELLQTIQYVQDQLIQERLKRKIPKQKLRKLPWHCCHLGEAAVNQRAPQVKLPHQPQKG